MSYSNYIDWECQKRGLSDEETAYVRSAYKEVKVSEDVMNYIMDIVEGTRKENNFVRGVSTRGALALYKAAQVTAAFGGRDYVIPEDVRAVCHDVMRHRIGLTYEAEAENMTTDQIISEIINAVEVP